MNAYIDGTMPEEFLTKVVGVSFSEGYPNNIYAIAKNDSFSNGSLRLVREPENEHDENAIRVELDGATLGHIPRLIALVLAPKLDNGERWMVGIHSIVVSQENVNQPGLKINVWREENVVV